ncbi:MAG: ATP-dependent protease subunit HslV [Armatimonadetes bacterium]|nr:ATP-dependent protease subunit HslV [Armatimonadota bacterium]
MRPRDTVHATTILAIKRGGKTVMAGDGQVTIGETVFKHSANKLRRMRDGKVLAGYAGSAADAMALFERLEGKLDEYSGNLPRACLQLVKMWRTDEVLRQLDAVLVVADRENLLLVTGTGDLLTPDEEVVSIGSGAGYARAAAEALLKHTQLPVEEIAREAMRITARICIYTNEHLTVEVLE